MGRDKEFDDGLGVDDSRECFVGCCCLLGRDFMVINAGLLIGETCQFSLIGRMRFAG